MKKINIYITFLILNILFLNIILADVQGHGPMIKKTRPFKDTKKRPVLLDRVKVNKNLIKKNKAIKNKKEIIKKIIKKKKKN